MEWRFLARRVLKVFNGLRLDFNLFLLDSSAFFKNPSLPVFMLVFLVSGLRSGY